MYDIIIIGGGPAGLTAALYAQRAGKTALVLESSGFGGQIVYTSCVENYPGQKAMSGAEFADSLVEQVLSAGAAVEFETAVELRDGDIKTVITDSNEYTAKSVIIAAGVKHRHLGLDGEDALIGSGISFCAVCDGAFYKGKRVAVVGGGNTALEDALYLSDIAEKVYLIHRRNGFRAENKIVKRAQEKENIHFILDAAVTHVHGSPVLDGIEVTNLKTGAKTPLDINGLFVAIGQMPQNDIFKTVIDLDENGYIRSGEGCTTNVPGIFAAGDCRTKSFRQLTTAVSDGTVAALAACEYIDGIFDRA